MHRTWRKSLVTAVLAASVVVAPGGGPAVADPAGPALPAAQDLVGVGDADSQAVLNQFSADYNATIPGSDTTTPRLYSWDATGAPTITTKTGATTIARPNGAEVGISALKNSTGATVDFARSSRGPLPTDPRYFDFVNYADDALSWAAPGNGNAPANLTTQNLKDIYDCDVTTWKQIDPALPGSTIKPFLPKAGSGTRASFLAALGIHTVNSCIDDRTVTEGQGSDPKLNDPDVLVPYSVGHYIGQAYYGRGSGADTQGLLTIRGIDGTAPVDATGRAINTDFLTLHGQTVYVVVRDADWAATDAHGAALRGVFGPDGWICTSSTAAADTRTYGFLPLPAGACGGVLIP
ncbi:substrate-binding domain-containing protein [Kitasatospora sp. NPDC059146]|uniref:substrate-binding domain-containing protein n=1 Tax=Kitasatospora sp. NPDC059146 TaxID=3346741 RepID=UPI00368403E6